MSFFRKHLPPTLHNAFGTVIGTVLLGGGAAVVGFVRPVRDFLLALAFVAVPLWTVVVPFSCCAGLLLVLRHRRKKKAAAAIIYMRSTDAQRIASLEDQLRQMTEERDRAIEQKNNFMYRLQEHSRRVGDVVSIRPASGAERSKGSER